MKFSLALLIVISLFSITPVMARQDKKLTTAERQQLIEQHIQAVDAKRATLKTKYESNFPTFRELYDMLQGYINLGDRFTRSDKEAFISTIEDKGFLITNTNKEIYTDGTIFKNHKGYEIQLYKLSRNNGGVDYLVYGLFPNVSKDIIELYAQELNSGYRDKDSAVINPLAPVPAPVVAESGTYSPFYVVSGGTIYFYEMKGEDTLKLWIKDNSNGEAAVTAERTDENTLKVTPWTNETDLVLHKGDTIQFNAEGTLKLGEYTGNCYPNGLEGININNINGQFNHACLMGKTGDSEWFNIGIYSKIVVPQTGWLQLKINDSDPANDEGFITVKYVVKKAGTN